MGPPSADQRVLLEICVDSVAGARAAQRGGADRLELCGNLVEGGTTPSAGLIQAVLEATDLPVMVMLRPRGGDFCYDADEWLTLQRELDAVLHYPIAGIVWGILTPDGQIDGPRCQQLVRQATGLSTTFHRAFDHASDARQALQQLIDLPVDRLLTSGQRPTATAGIPLLRALVRQARGRLAVMSGCGIGAENVQAIVRETGVREVHLSASQWIDSRARFRRPEVPLSAATTPGDAVRRVTSEDRVRAVRQALQQPVPRGATPAVD